MEFPPRFALRGPFALGAAHRAMELPPRFALRGLFALGAAHRAMEFPPRFALRGLFALGAAHRAHVSSPISAPSGGRITLSTGASVGTPSVRSAAPVTAENTGAATAPP